MVTHSLQLSASQQKIHGSQHKVESCSVKAVTLSLAPFSCVVCGLPSCAPSSGPEDGCSEHWTWRLGDLQHTDTRLSNHVNTFKTICTKGDKSYQFLSERKSIPCPKLQIFYRPQVLKCLRPTPPPLYHYIHRLTTFSFRYFMSSSLFWRFQMLQVGIWMLSLTRRLLKDYKVQ